MGLPDREDWSGARWIALEEDVDSLIVINGTFDTGPDNPILGNKPFGRNKLPLLRREFTGDGLCLRTGPVRAVSQRREDGRPLPRSGLDQVR